MINIKKSFRNYITGRSYASVEMQSEYSTAPADWAKSPCSIMAKILNSDLKVSEFKLQLCYYVHIQSYTLGKSMNPLILPAMG